MGDVKLAAVLGLFLGRSVAVAILSGVLIGAIVGAAVMARVGVEEGRKTAVPFGPFLALGGVIGLLAGPGRSSTGTCTPDSDVRAGASARRAPRRAPLLAGVHVAILAALALSLLHHGPPSTLAPHAAIRAALRDRSAARTVSAARWDRVSASAARRAARARELLERRADRRAGGGQRSQTGRRGRMRTRAARVPVRRLDRLHARAPDRAERRVPARDARARRGGACATSMRSPRCRSWSRCVLFQHRYLDPSLVAAAPGAPVPARALRAGRRSAATARLRRRGRC